MTIAAVERALKLIEALAGEPDGVDLSLLAERLDLPFSATHRLLATLAERGVVDQDAQSGAYGLTLKLAQLAFRDLDSRGLPLGLQLIGRPFDEETLFSLGEVIEQAAGRFPVTERWWG